MKAQNQLVTCDICKKQITLSINEPMIGGTPYHGWFKLERISTSSCLSSNCAKTWDLCSARCLSQLCDNVLVDEFANAIPGAENLAEEFKKSTELVFKKHKLIE